MANKIKVIKWCAPVDDESSVYRLDERGAGERFFRDMLNNAETDGREKFKILELTEKQWQECVDAGNESA